MNDNLEHRINDGEKEIIQRLESIRKDNGFVPEIIEGDYTIRSGKYILDHDIHVMGKLIIEKNTVITFQNDNGIYVESASKKRGELHIEGTADEPVMLKPQSDSWYGIDLYNSRADNHIAYTHIIGAKKERGGGICSVNSKLHLDGSVIEGCESAFQGGGIYSKNSLISIDNTTIKENRSGTDAGGIHCGYKSEIKLYNSIVEKNLSGASGGGIAAHSSKIWIDNTCIFYNIENFHDKIELYDQRKISDSDLKLLWNSLDNIFGNESVIDSSGIYLSYSELWIRNSPIMKNITGFDASSILEIISKMPEEEKSVRSYRLSKEWIMR